MTTPDTHTDPTLDVEDLESFETIEFTTPDRKRKVVETPVDLCGVEYKVRRPKDAALFFISSAYAESSTDSDRTMALIQFIEATHTKQDYAAFLERACDREDPLRLASAYKMMEELLSNRWDPKTKVPASTPVIIKPEADLLGDDLKPIRIRNDDLDLDLVCHPPKDLALAVVASSMATGASDQQKSFGMRFFLDASLDKPVAISLMRRWLDPLDDLDIPELEEISQALMERWYPEGAAQKNRKSRRVQAAKSRKKTTAKKKTTDDGQDG